MEVTSSVVVPILRGLHAKGDDSGRRVGTRVLPRRVPSSIINGEGLAGDDTVLESTTGEVGVVLKGHDEEDGC